MDGTFVRMYVCPICGEKEVISRKVTPVPVFNLQGVQHASNR